MKLRKSIYFVLLMSIIFLPKINIISFENITAGIRIDDILIFISFLAYLLFSSKDPTLDLRKYKQIKTIFYIYFIFILFSTILGIILGNVKLLISIIYVIRKLEYFTLFYIGYDYAKSDKKIFTLFNIIVLFNFIIIILQMYGYVGAISSGRVYTRILTRYYSIFNGPYEMSAFLLGIVPFYTLKLIKKENMLISFASLGMILFNIIQSGSRSSIVLYIFIVILMLLRQEKNLRIKFTFTAFLILILMFSMNIVDAIYKNTRFNTLKLSEIKSSVEYSWSNKNIDNINENIDLSFYDYGDASFNIRIMKWCNYLDGFLMRPLFGLGMSIVKNASDGAYIRCLVESGIIGSIIWLFLMFKVITIKLKDKFKQNYIKYSWILLLLGAVFIDLFDASKIMCFYWFLLGTFVREKSENHE